MDEYPACPVCTTKRPDMKKLLAIFTTLFVFCVSYSQDSTGKTTVSMKENWDAGIVNTLKQSGGIYGVIAVIAIIVGGIYLYLYRLEKKINRLEQQHKN
jgi:type IV secretory pathway VirB2 component (pilin)